MSYSPQIPPQDEKQLLPFLSDEFAKVASSYNDLQDGFMGVAYNVPERLRPGMLKIFDGTEANPESTGLNTAYIYGLDGVWRGLAYHGSVVDLANDLAALASDTADGQAYLVSLILDQQAALDDLFDYIMDSIGETAWANITYENGWTSAGTSLYRRYSKGVDLIITANAGTRTDGTVLATLPVGFRPPAPCTFPIFANSITGLGAIPFFQVETNGQIKCYGLPSAGNLFGSTVRIPI